MSRLLFNAGVLQFRGSNAQVIDAADTASDCVCCGGEFNCLRCEETEPYYPGRILSDFVLEVTNTSNVFEVMRESNATRTNIVVGGGGQPAPCNTVQCQATATRYRKDELVLSGFAALNGTYYGIPNTSDIDLGSGFSSLGGGCGGYVDPTTTIPTDECLETNPCFHDCANYILVKRVPITGTMTCGRTSTSTCAFAGQPAGTIDNSNTYDLDGYAELFLYHPTETSFTYGPSQPTFDLYINWFVNATKTSGVGSASFGMNGAFAGDNYGGFTAIECVPDSSVDVFQSAPTPCYDIGIASAALFDFTCDPLWISVAVSTNMHTCYATDQPNPTINSINMPLCDDTDSTSTVGFLPLAPCVSPGTYDHTLTIFKRAFTSDATLEWVS